MAYFFNKSIIKRIGKMIVVEYRSADARSMSQVDMPMFC